MRYQKLIALILGVLLVSCQSQGKKSKGDFGDLTKFPDSPLVETKLPSFETADLENKGQILWMPDNKLPSLSVKIMIKGGTKDEPKDKSGSLALMARLMDKGTANKTAVQIAEFFESQGAQFSVQVSDDYTVISLDALSTNQDTVIPTFIDVVFAPTFPDDEFQREKVKMGDELKRLPDDAQSFVEVAFQKYLYAKTPYGRMMDDLASLNRKDVLQAYKSSMAGPLIRAGVVGQWNENSRKLIETALMKLPADGVVVHKPVEFTPIKGRKIRLVVKDDLKQTQIRIGGQGLARKDPDFLKMSLAASALGAGGSFASRLLQEIRVKRGLTYSIYGSFEAHVDTGSYEISTFTRHEKIQETVEQTLNQLNLFVEKGMTQEELSSNRSFLSGTIARQTETTTDVMNRLLLMRVFEVPDSYLIDFNKNLRAIELAPLNTLIKKRFPDANLKILVFGPKKEALEQLSKLGPVEVIDYKEVLKKSIE